MNTTPVTSRTLPFGWLVASGLLALACAILVAWNWLIGIGITAAILLIVVSFRWPAAGLVISLLTLIAGQTVRLPLFGSESNLLPNDVIVPLVIFGWLLRCLADRRRLLGAGALERAMAGFLAVLVLSLIAAWLRHDFSQRQLFVAGLYIVRWIEYAALFFLARSVVRQPTLGRWIALLGSITLALALLGFLQLKVLPDFSAYVPQGWDPHVGRLLSTWFDPNFLAGFFAFSALVFLSLAHEVPQRRWWSLGLAAVTLLALVLTFSRSGYAGFLIGFAVLAIFRARHFLPLGLLTILAVFLFVPRVQERVIGVRSVDETAQLRITSWRNALTALADHPWLGVGYNTYRYVQVEYGFVKDVAEHSAGGSDSSFLTIAVTTGVVGAVAFLILLASMLATAWNASRRATNNLTRSFGWGVLAGLIALIVHGQFVNGLLYPHLLETQWVALGLLVGVSHRQGASV